MRRMARLYAHDAKGMIPRMSWSSHNLYNLIARSTVPANVAAVTFRNVNSTMYQQRWRAKRFLRGYHGDWIGEGRFRRWYLPTTMPKLQPIRRPAEINDASLQGEERAMTEKERLPITGLFLREVERRLDTTVFRCCFARSAREARAMVVQGKVKVNGVRNNSAGHLLNPGDMISVEPTAIPMLSEVLAQRAKDSKAKARKAEQDRIKAAKQEVVSAEGGSESVEAQVEGQSADVEGSGEAQEGEAADLSAETKDGEAQSAEERTSEAVEKAVLAAENASQDRKKAEELPPGVLPFNLPPFAAPFLFVPPNLEVSFTTCSAIYVRHPTLTANPRAREPLQPQYLSDIPSPYSATGDIFSLAWELYSHDAPRIRSDLRRLQHEARFGRSGLRSARAKDQWRKVLAIRRKRDRDTPLSPQPASVKTAPAEFLVGGRSAAARRPHVSATA